MQPASWLAARLAVVLVRAAIMSKKHLRRQIFVHRPIQGVLVGRIVLYWLLSLFIQAMLLMLLSAGTGATDEFYERTQQFWWHLRLVGVTSLLTLPLLVLDIVKLSHRCVGPIIRLRNSMQALAMGEPVEPIAFRTGDYWPELATDFNAVLARVKHLEQSSGESPVTRDTEPAAV